MTALGKKILSILLWTWGGTVYFMLEVLWKTASNEPEKISWTMLVLAIFLTISVERCGYQLPWEIPLVLQSLLCATLVTISELIAGIILNIWLNLNIWDYSSLPFNLMGQICPQFFLIWWILCFAFIPMFDWMRWSIEGGTKPTYKIFMKRG